MTDGENRENPQNLENPENETLITEEESTIFGRSPVKDEVVKRPKNKKMLKSVLSAVLALAILGGATLSAYYLIPKKENETVESEHIHITEIESSLVETVKLTRKDSVSVFRTTVTKGEGDSDAPSVSWSIDGIDPSLTESSSISLVTTDILNLEAITTVEKEENGDYGMDNPEYTVEIKSYDGTADTSYTVGCLSPSSSGYYVNKADDDTIYLADRETIEKFATPEEEMSTASALPKQTDNTGNSSYFESGTLSTFDSIKISRKGYDDVVIVPNKSEVTKGYCEYLTTAPLLRFADTEAVTPAFSAASNGLTCAAVYKYSPTDADIKAYSLNNPENRLTIKYGNQVVTVEASRSEEGYYAALINGQKNAIFKLADSVVEFFTKTPDDFVSTRIYAEYSNTVTQMIFNEEGKETVVDVEFIEDDDKGVFYYPKCNGKDIKGQWYLNFYAYLEDLEPQGIANEVPKEKPSFSVTAVTENETNEYAFIKSGMRKYTITRNGVPVANIASTYYDRLVKVYKLLVSGKEVPEL